MRFACRWAQAAGGSCGCCSPRDCSSRSREASPGWPSRPSCSARACWRSLAMLPSSVSALVRIVPLAFDRRACSSSRWSSPGSPRCCLRLLPALHATRLTLVDALQGQPGVLRRSRTRAVLVGGQVAVSIVLVIVAASFVRNTASLSKVDLGYEIGGVTSVQQRIPGPPLVARAVAALRTARLTPRRHVRIRCSSACRRSPSRPQGLVPRRPRGTRSSRPITFHCSAYRS